MATSKLSFDEARLALRKFRDHPTRNSEEVVELWQTVLQKNETRLGEEVWAIYEQVFVALLDCGDMNHSRELLEKLYQRFPSSQRVRKLNALYKEAAGHFEEALDIYDKLLEVDATNPVYRKRKIAVLLGQQKRVEAIEELIEYLKTFLNDKEAWLQLSSLYLAELDYAKAAHCMEEVILSQPYEADYLVRYADIKYTQGGLENIEIAKQYFIQASRLNPSSLRAAYGALLACEWLAQKQTGQKKKDYVAVGTWAAERIVEIYTEE
uniref:ER membrane protein complex subunit 2 n=1 Tax=Plectus sambesii TaxID=2011161 RepID=A0A914UJR3_9BILA